MRPLTLDRPKALVPFCGVALIELVLSRFSSLAAGTIVVNACHEAAQLGAWIEARPVLCDRRVLLSMESELLSTGGGLRRGLQLVPDARHVLAHNADVVLDYDLGELLAYYHRTQADAVLLLVPESGPRTVDLGPDGRITTFRQPRGRGQYTFSGVQVFGRQVLDYLPDAEAPSIVEAYERALADGARIVGLSVGDAFWADLGTRAAYLESHARVARVPLKWHMALMQAVDAQRRRRRALTAAGSVCTGGLGMGRNVTVPAGSRLHDCVLWDDTELATPLVIAHGVLGGGRIAGPAPVTDSRRPDPRLLATLAHAPETVHVAELGCQGSGRRYCRLTVGDRSWMWCAYDQRRRENAGFAAVSWFLTRLGLSVPEVLVHLPDVGELAVTDLGDCRLVDITDVSERRDLLCLVARQMARLHVLGPTGLEKDPLPLQDPFTEGLYRWEAAYFRDEFLEGLLGAGHLWQGVGSEWAVVRDALLAQPAVPLHRDLQSANIMVVDGRPYLIDYQGMRLGAAAYDMASLLYDPYCSHAPATRNAAWRVYTAAVRELDGNPPTRRLLHLAAVQRLCQALGAYGKLSRRDGLAWYATYVTPALHALRAVAAEARLDGVADLADRCLALVR